MKVSALLLFTSWAAQGQITSTQGLWSATFSDGTNKNRTMEVYNDGLGNKETRFKEFNDSGRITRYKQDKGISFLNATYDTLFFPRTDTSVEADPLLNVTWRGGLDTSGFFMLFSTISPDSARTTPCDSGVCGTFSMIFVKVSSTRAFTLPDLLAPTAIFGKNSFQNGRNLNYGRLIWKEKPSDVLGRFNKPKSTIK